MNQYNLERLSDSEFEEFSKDLLETHFNIEFKSFRKGKDKGIDLIFDSKGEKIIVQVKHYINSSFSNLKSTMKSEFIKMNEFLPNRYLLFVSMDLTVGQCDEIISIMGGHIKSINDIIDLKMINTLLSREKYKWVEEKYYKIWLTNTGVISRILHNAQINHIEDLVNDITNKIKFFVITESYHIAKEKLENHGFLMILGEPGVGKTTLANLLILNYLEEDYSLKFVAGHNLHELESILDKDNKSKELIFLDDFLGTNYLELINGNTENRLTNFIRKYSSNKSKKVVLTTRTVIYKKAITLFEKLDALDPSIVKFSIELSSYSEEEKAKILYNHCYFLLEESYFNALLENKNYLKVIKHKNYNPRIIEFVTLQHNYTHVLPNNYFSFILKQLNNPERIWKFEYNTKLSNEERFIIDTLFSFGGASTIDVLQEAFDRRYESEIAINSIPRIHDPFNTSLRVLSDGFIKMTINANHLVNITFINPSINDFLIAHFLESLSDAKRIIVGIKYIEQFMIFKSKLFKEKTTYDYESLLKLTEKVFIDNYEQLKSTSIGKLKYLIDEYPFLLDKSRVDSIISNEFNTIIRCNKMDNDNDAGAIIRILTDYDELTECHSKFKINFYDLSILIIERIGSVEDLCSLLKFTSIHIEEGILYLVTLLEFEQIINTIINDVIEDNFEELFVYDLSVEDYLLSYDGNTPDFDVRLLQNRIEDFVFEQTYAIEELVLDNVKSKESRVLKKIESIFNEIEIETYKLEKRAIDFLENQMRDEDSLYDEYRESRLNISSVNSNYSIYLFEGN